MAAVTRFLLVRHGQSTWNAERRWQGQADPPLSDHGRDQAIAATAKICAVDAIVSSPQIRALDTAQVIAEGLGIGPIVLVPELRERHAGPWSGLTVEEIEQQYPGFLADHRRPDGYESDAELIARTLPALENLARRFRGQQVLVLTHGGVIHNFEEHLGITAWRVPNLCGRVATFRLAESEAGHLGTWEVGESLELIESGSSTGGDPDRV